jgi:hypothetical protein
MGIKRIQVSEDLKALINKHEGRANFALQTSVSTAESLLRTFDEYVRIEIGELKQQVSLLESVRRDLKKEKEKVRMIEFRFNGTYDRLKRTLELAKDGKITTIATMAISNFNENELPNLHMQDEKNLDESVLEIDVIIESFKIISELEEVRKDVRRWVDTYTGDIDDMVSIVDERMSEKD